MSDDESVNLNKRIPAELHKRLRLLAAERGESVQDLVVEVLDAGIRALQGD